MKVKKIMPVVLILLAVLTIGAVSAGEDSGFDEALTADNGEEVSLGASTDDYSIDDGKNDTGSVLDESAGDFSDDENYGDAGSDDSASDSVDEILTYKEGDDVISSPGGNFSVMNVIGTIKEDSFDFWIASHGNDGGNDICNVWFEEEVHAGTLTLSVEKFDGSVQTYDRDVYTSDVQWKVEDLDIIDETGPYTINLTYELDGLVIPLVENHVFTFTQFYYETCENIYIAYPFDVIRFENQKVDEDDEDSEYVTVKVYVNGAERGFGGENPYRWTLNDLGIENGGEYDVRIEAYDGDDFVEEISYTLNVDDSDDIRLFSNDLGIESWEVKKPVLYLAIPDEYLGRNAKLTINDDPVSFTINSTLMNWTLENLGIDSNGEYEIKLFDDNDDEIASTWMNVNGIISPDTFDCWMSFYENYYSVDSAICEVWIDQFIGEGRLILSIVKSNGSVKEYPVDISGDNEFRWELGDLDIFDEHGVYSINLTYADDDNEFSITENNTFILTELNYGLCGDVYIEYPFDVIRFYDDGEDQYAVVYVNDEERAAYGENPFRWRLADLGIENAGEYAVTIKGFNEDGPVEEFSYTLNVFDDVENPRVFSSELGVRGWEMKGSVLYFICPDDMVGNHFTLYVNDDPVLEFDSESIMNWTFDDLGIDRDDGYGIKIFNEYGDEIASTYFDVECIDETKIQYEMWNEEEQGKLYLGMSENIISISIPEGTSGILYVIINNEVRYVTIARHHDDDTEEEDFGFVIGRYDWCLYNLNITEEGVYNITLVFFDGVNNETVASEMIHVYRFKNDTFRARIGGHDARYLDIFCPEGSEGDIIVFQLYNGRINDVVTYQITADNYNVWKNYVPFEDEFSGGYEPLVLINGVEIRVEEAAYDEDSSVMDWIGMDFGEVSPGQYILAVWNPFNKQTPDATISFTNGNYTISKKVEELGIGEWTQGSFNYYVTFEDLEAFENFNDKDIITITFESQYGKQVKYWALKKDADSISVYEAEYVKYGQSVLFILIPYDAGTDFDIRDTNDDLLSLRVPKSFNTTAVELKVTSSDGILYSFSLSDLDYEFSYDFGDWIYEHVVKIGDINFAGLNDDDVVNFTLTFDGMTIYSRQFIYNVDDNTAWFVKYHDQISGVVNWGRVGSPQYGVSQSTDNIIKLAIPAILNITEGTLEITLDDGSVVYSKSLSQLNVSAEDLDLIYTVSAKGFDYDTSMPDGANITVSFIYNNTQMIIGKGIRIDDYTYRHVIPEEVAEYFTITLPDPENVLVDGEDNVMIITATERANRQSVPIGLGDGHFEVYVNGEKVEDLGRLIRVDGEKELEAYRLESDFRNLLIYLGDLDITENGVYAIKVIYKTKASDFGVTGVYVTELFDQNVTLTSNVRPNYQNSSVEWLTGYGLDPDLLYLDTYYGDINETTGIVTVLNGNGKEIFTSDIRSLPLKEGRRYLKYSDFEDDFTDGVTLKYSDGNERNGETSLDVLWRNVTSEDFSPAVNINVEDYYANFMSLDIPDVINEGQIVVTVKFNNVKGTNISNMNVSKDFDSKAVYRFSIADIKANYGNNFAFSLSDLEFFEDNGDYEVDVKFTAGNGTSMLDIANNTLNVELLKDVLISINETSRYGMELPFASVKIFEPINAYAELYIDGKLYSHRTFEKGLIVFTSSPKWAPGTHTAEIKVFNSEFGSLLNSSAATFETLIQTSDVTVEVNTTIRENENATISITVPQSGNVTVRIDGGDELTFHVGEGANTIDLGHLSMGNHTVWILYENNESTSFYNNYITITVGDDGSWLDFPEKIELNGSDVIRINVGEGAEGYVLIYIDGKLVANRTVNGTLDISLSEYLRGDNVYGMHNYSIIYYDINGNIVFSRNGTFNVTYIFHDNIDKNGVPLQEYYVVIVSLPEDATGTVRITVNGQSYTQTVVNGQAIFIIEGLPMGEYDVFVEYLGDDKYPPMSYHTLLNVSYYGVVGEFDNGKRIIRLMLPENATGNLTVFNDNRREILKSVPLIDGKAKIDLADLPVGIYEIRAYYEGTDYEVRPFSTTFKVMPNVYISQGVYMDEDVEIFVDLDNATGKLVIIMDGLSPVIEEIENGVVNYTLSTKNYSRGNHTVSFMYFGNSFDPDVFNELDENGRYKPIEYPLEILGLELKYSVVVNQYGEVNITVNETMEGVIEVYYNGEHLFDINTTKTDDVQILNGYEIRRFVRDGLVSYVFNIMKKTNADSSEGELLVKFSKSPRFNDATTSKNIKSTKQVAKIAAKDFTVLYSSSSKYSVTVYNKNGKVASGENVIFLVNNKKYGSAKTNSKGVASIAIKSAPGSYKIISKALGVSATKTLKVTHVVSLKKVKVKKSAKKLVIKATLKKVNGKYLKSKKVTFKFNGKKYTATTNKKGVAKITVKSKALKKLKVGKKVKYQATYLKDTVKKSVKVKK